MGYNTGCFRVIINQFHGTHILIDTTYYVENIYHTYMYSIRERRARDLIDLTTPTFLDYFDRRVIPLLKLNMDTKEKTGLPKTVAPWTNNNCESANHFLKQAVQWKGQCLVQLIDTLHSIVKGQYKDLKRAIINGLGNFHIIPPLQKRLCMDASVWERKTPEQQKTHYERLLTTPVLTADNVVVSSDGQEVSRFAPDGGKKKNQTKRKINARTTTVNKKQRH